MTIANDSGLTTSAHSGAPAPTDSAPAGFLPIMFPSEGTETPVKDDLHLRPVLFVDSTAPAVCLLAAAKLRLDLLDSLVNISVCWESGFEDNLREFGQLLEPFLAESSALVAAALKKGGAA